MKSIAYVGLDVHREQISVAVVPPLLDGQALALTRSLRIECDPSQVLEERRLANGKQSVQHYFRRLAGKYDIRCCYEASSCGYVLHRWLQEIDVACDVIAPSLVPRRPGEHVKTDRLDALKLARYHRSGELTAVHVPTVEEESDRALVRHRETLSRDVARAKNRILKVLDRHAIEFHETKSSFTQKHRNFLKGLHFSGEEEYAFRDGLAMLDYLELRLAGMDKRVEALARTERYAAGVGKLCCMRGIRTLGAMVLLTETFDFTRFGEATKLMGYWGFGVREDTSADQRRQGSITKAGNEHCRWILVEASKHYQHAPGISEDLKKRQEGQPPEVIAHCWKAQQRLHNTYWKVMAHTKCANKAAVAVGREASGFVWAIMTDRCGLHPTGTA